MKRLIDFGEILQYRNIIHNIKRMTEYKGQDENDEAIFCSEEEIKNLEYPIIEAIGTEKIHGTNLCVSYSNLDGLWVQSRKNIITPENDNAGSAFFVNKTKEAWIKIIKDLAQYYEINLNENIISVYSEFAGGKIQKKSALTSLDKRAMIFQHFKVSPIEPDENIRSEWYKTSICTENVKSPENNIFNIMDFPKQRITLDFNHPEIAKEEMEKMIKEIEKSSKVGEQFGIKGNTGEGFVFTFVYKDTLHRFKVKGEKHSNQKTRVKKIKTKEETLEETLEEQKRINFVNKYACVSWRLEQAIQEVNDTLNGGVPDIKKMGDVIKWVIKDNIKENLDIMTELNIEPKDLNKYISKVTRDFYIDFLNKEVGI